MWEGVALKRPTLAARTISTILKFSQPFGFINGCVGYQIEAYDVLYNICSQFHSSSSKIVAARGLDVWNTKTHHQKMAISQAVFILPNFFWLKLKLKRFQRYLMKSIIKINWGTQMVNGILWKTLKSPCGAPLCTYAKVHNKKNYIFLISIIPESFKVLAYTSEKILQFT